MARLTFTSLAMAGVLALVVRPFTNARRSMAARGRGGGGHLG